MFTCSARVFTLAAKIHELFQASVAKHGKFKAMGTRTFIDNHTPAGAKFPLKVFGDTTWKTYAEV
jgi:hypothetical protein